MCFSETWLFANVIIKATLLMMIINVVAIIIIIADLPFEPTLALTNIHLLLCGSHRL